MGSVAAQTMAWQRRARNRPGPLSPVSAPTGDSPNGSVLQVELLVDGQWTDITSRVMTRDGTGAVAINRGEPNEGSATEAGSCHMELNNRDGLFTARNPRSPYFGKLSRNQPIRVSVPSGNAKSYRFWGEVSAWPQTWDPTGTDVSVQLEGAGLLRRLGQGTAVTGSTLSTAISSGALSNPVVAYWPCEDGADATSVAAGIAGVQPMTIIGTLSLAAFSGFACSAPLPDLGSSGLLAGQVPTYTPQLTTMVRFLVAVPSGGATDGQVLCYFLGSGSIQRWEIYYTAALGGQAGLRALTSTGTVVADTGPNGVALNGQLAQLSAEISQVGPDLQFWMYTLIVGTTGESAFGATASAQTIGTISQVVVGGALSNTAIGHIRVQTCSTNPPNDIFDLSSQLVAYAGEAAPDRISRLCGLIGEQYEQIGASSAATAMGTQLLATPISLITDCQAADDGILFESTSVLGLGYRTRASLENQQPALTLDYAAGNLAEPPVPVDDDRYASNDVTVRRTGGSSARVVQTSGALSTAPPPAGIGVYPDSVTVNISADTDLFNQAGWRLHLGTVDEARYPQISVNLAHASFVANPTLRQQVLAVRPGDRVTIANPPAWLPPDQISQIVIGFAESIDHFQHRIRFNCVPESPYRTAVLEDTLLCRLDSGGSQMTDGALATDTAFRVTTTSGPTWTTDLSDTPFDLRISGEQVTLVAVGTVLNPNPLLLTDLSGYSAQNSSIARSTTVVNTSRGAVASIQITPNGSNSFGGVLGTTTAAGTVTPGASYIASMWVYSPAGWSDLQAAIDWFDSSGTYLSTGSGAANPVPAGTWQFFQQTLVAPASASKAGVRAKWSGTPAVSDVWFVWGLRLVPAASVTSTSPQTITVVRGVNGITKALPIGADVRLNQPMTLSL